MYNWIVVFVCLLFINNVSGDCIESLTSVPTLLRFDETQSGIQLNMTYTKNDSWTIKVVKINAISISDGQLSAVDKYFRLETDSVNGRLYLNVTQPIDLEEFIKFLETEVRSISLSFKCDQTVTKEVLIIIDAVNEMPLKFIQFPYRASITENAKAGLTVFNVSEHVKDDEIRRNGDIYYFIEPYIKQLNLDGREYFSIPFSSQGIVILKDPIDFDNLHDKGLPTYFLLNLTVEDSTRLKSWAILNVSVLDFDDQDPVFTGFNPGEIAQYRVQTKADSRGNVTTKPYAVNAIDLDSFNNSIVYTLERVPYLYSSSFQINPSTGQLSQNADVLDTGVLTIKATENSAQRRSVIATVQISLGNNTAVATMKPEVRVLKEESSMAMIIIAVVAVVIIIGIIIVFVVYHKKVVKSVSPQDDGTASNEDISHSQNWPASGSKAELLASEMLNPAFMATIQGRGNTLPTLTKDSATETGKKRSRRRNKNKEPEIFDGTREYEGKLDLEFFEDANTKTKIKQSTRSRDTKTDPKYWITIPNDDD